MPAALYLVKGQSLYVVCVNFFNSFLATADICHLLITQMDANSLDPDQD